ncbi:hypothetical protein RCL1_001783 [Eukaryota sp. TZLM3-RCL]
MSDPSDPISTTDIVEEEDILFEEEAPESVDDLMAVSFRNVAAIADVNLQDVLTYVRIIEGSELLCRNSSGVPSPVVRLTLFTPRGDTTKYTAKAPHETAPRWDRTLFFPSRLAPGELEKSRLLVEVIDSGGVLKSQIIGSHELSLQLVRDQESHAFICRWVALSSTEHPGVQGLIKLSVAVVFPGECMPVDDEVTAGKGISSKLTDMIITPPGIETAGYRLNLRLFRGKQFPKLDKIGTCDGYCKISFASLSANSSVIQNNLHPTWNELISVPVITPTMSDVISLKFYNAKKYKSDELFAELNFSFKSIVASPLSPRWYHLYCNNSGNYMGSVYLAISADSCTIEEASTAVKRTKVEAAPAPPVVPYSCLITVCEASDFPERYSICANFGGVFSKSSNFKSNNGHSKPYILLDELIQNFPNDSTQLPDVNIIISKKDTLRDSEFGVVRIPAVDVFSNEFNHDNWLPQWYSCFGSGAGSLLLKVVIVPSNLIDYATFPKPVPYSVQWYSFNINIVRAENLLPLDQSGLSDPFVIIKCGGFTARTFTVLESLNPCWFQCFSADIPLNLPPVPLSPLSFELRDWNKIGKDDSLGFASIDIQSLFGKPCSHLWLPVKLKNNGKECGRLLVSIEINPLAQPPKTPSRSQSPMKLTLVDRVIEVEAVGLRDLDVAKPSFMEFRFPAIDRLLGGQSTPGTIFDDKFWQITTTTPTKEPSPFNPNILKTLILNVKVPSVPEFCPVVEARVYIQGQLRKKLLGNCFISLTSSTVIQEAGASVANSSEETNGEGVDICPRDDYLVYVEDDSLPSTTNQLALAITKPQVNPTSFNVELGSVIYITTPAEPEARSLPPVPTSALSLGVQTFTSDAGDVLDGREQLLTELEQSDFLNESPFDFWDLISGSAGKNWYTLNRTTLTKKGVFKGKVRLLESREFLRHTNLGQMYRNRKLKCRIFLMDASALVAKSKSGDCDPYPVIKLGAREIKVMEKMQKKNLNPEFYYSTEIEVDVPGDCDLHLSVYDKNAVFSDSLVGSTIIDLEARALSAEFSALSKSKLPVERRTLFSPTTTSAQGSLRCWIELITPEQSIKTPLPPFNPPPSVEGELRVVFWRTLNVPFGRADFLDLKMTAKLGGNPKLLTALGKESIQSSDVDRRAPNGNCHFNWRFVYPVDCRVGDVVRLQMQLWDNNLLRPNDYLAEVYLDLRPLVAMVGKSGKSLRLDKQKLAMRHPLHPGSRGQVELEVHLLTTRDAKLHAAGKGRSEPNDHPRLEAPLRLGFARWRVDKLVMFYVKKYKMKAYVVIGILLFLILLRFMFWIRSWFK